MAEIDLSLLQGEALEQALASPEFPLDRVRATAVRDGAAAHLFSDPARAFRISGALLRALKRSASPPDPVTRAIVWRCRAEGCFYTGRMTEAKKAYEQAVAAARAAAARASGPQAIVDGGLLGQILVGRIALLALMGESEASARLVPQAERMLRRAGDLIYLAKLQMNRGNALYHQERFQDAYDAYGRAAACFARAGTRDATWIGLRINQGIASAHLSRIEEARKLFLESEEQARALALPHLEAQAKFNRAQAERIRGDYRQALLALEDAGEAFEKGGVRDLAAAALLARAEIYLELGMAPEAEDLARAAGQTFTREQMPFDAVVSGIAEARALQLQRRTQEALELFERAERFYALRRIRPQRAAVLLHRSRTLLALGRIREARSAASRALRTFVSQGMRQQASSARRALAETYLAEGGQARAETILREATRAAAIVPLREKLELWALAGRISVARRRPGEAVRRFRRALRYVEAQRRLIPGIELRSRAFENQVEVYHELIRLLLESGSPPVDALFPLLQASRARGFRERLAAPVSGRAAVTEEKRFRLGSLVERLEKEERATRPDPGRMRLLHREIHALESEIERKLQRVQGREAGAPRWGGADPRRVMRRLRPDEAVIEYFIAGERAHALVLRSDAATVRPLPSGASEIRDQIGSLRLQFETIALTSERPLGDPAFLQKRAEISLGRLHSFFVEPLLDLLPRPGRLVIVPHGILHQVPFESLHDGSDYIDAGWIVTRCPASDLVAEREPPAGPRRPRKVVVAGVLEGGPEQVGPEIQSVAACFPRDRVTVLRDPSASELMDRIAGADIVHLSTHAVFREDNPAFSRLRMRDGSLFLVDLMDRRIASDLVVLSACNTGRVFAGRGDDLSGVAHAFLAGGARQLVASRWRVHDEATREMMESFYRHLEAGRVWDPGAALREAIREARGRRAHPFYWAGFSLHGR